MAASRNSILRLIRAAQSTTCPCHQCAPTSSPHAVQQLRHLATPVLHREYAFEASCSVHQRPLSILSHSGRRIQSQIWRRRHARGRNGPEEHEGTQGWRVHRSKCGQPSSNEKCRRLVFLLRYMVDESRPLLRWNLNRIFRSKCTTKWWQSLPKKAGEMLLPGPGNTTSATFSRVFFICFINRVLIAL